MYHNSLNLHKLNKSIICLIPKEKDASHIGKYRPISLVNCSFKFISKILTHRLTSFMSRIVDDSQSAFLPNRYILDNMVLSQEILHYSNTNNHPGVVIKVDFEKAYDKIQWEYLLEVLKSRGFNSRWLHWIANWLRSFQSCISINGKLTPYFYCKRGIRQGDHLSPYLFILASDSLSNFFSKGRQAQVLKGLGPTCFNNQAITNCHYADDSISFLEAKHKIVEAVWWAMQAFEAVSGIEVNLDKTELYSLNTDLTHELAHIFRCKIAHFPLKYLGLPLHDNKLRGTDWRFLIDKVEKKLQNWKGQLLSLGAEILY